MKKKLRKLIWIMIGVCSAIATNAQQVATFENLPLATNSYWNGSTTKGGPKDTVTVDTTFLSGDAIFPNTYNIKNYKYWKAGWAYSSKTDTITAGSTNMYGAFAYKGFNNSNNYANGTQNSIIRLNANAIGKKVKGFYVTNGTYAGISMRDGDGPNGFARRFGDTTKINSGKPHGDVKDWFRLTIKGFSNGSLKNDSVNFYLADYRFDDNSKDYIVNTWEWIDLTSLGNVDSLIFKLNSSDVGPWGMNTPAYFCIDNFTTESTITSIASWNDSNILKIYPNPATDELTIDLSDLTTTSNTINVLDVAGRRIETVDSSSPVMHLPISSYRQGIYLISIKNTNGIINTKFIKN